MSLIEAQRAPKTIEEPLISWEHARLCIAGVLSFIPPDDFKDLFADYGQAFVKTYDQDIATAQQTRRFGKLASVIKAEVEFITQDSHALSTIESDLGAVAAEELREATMLTMYKRLQLFCRLDAVTDAVQGAL